MKQQSTTEIANQPGFQDCAGANPFYKSDQGVPCLRSTHRNILARYACDLDPYLISTCASGTRLSLDFGWLAAQLDGHSKRSVCFLGWPTVDGSDVGLPDNLMSLLRKQKSNTASLIVAASLLGDSSLFCDAYQVVTALNAIGAPVSHYAIGKLGSLVLTVGLDTCYAFNTVISSVWVVLPAYIVWLHRKASDMGAAAEDPDFALLLRSP